MPVAVIILLAAAAPLWAILAAEMWTPVPDRALHLVQPGAPTITILAAIIWAADGGRKRYRLMQERERVLIRVIDSLDGERPRPPFQVVG